MRLLLDEHQQLAGNSRRRRCCGQNCCCYRWYCCCGGICVHCCGAGCYCGHYGGQRSRIAVAAAVLAVDVVNGRGGGCGVGGAAAAIELASSGDLQGPPDRVLRKLVLSGPVRGRVALLAGRLRLAGRLLTLSGAVRVLQHRYGTEISGDRVKWNPRLIDAASASFGISTGPSEHTKCGLAHGAHAIICM